MKRLISAVALAGLAVSANAFALGAMADVTVIDRDSGAVLSTHFYRGEYWVAGRPGAKYAIRVQNRAGGRLLAVTSVDGINVLSGANAAWDQEGYVFDPGASYQITGWRKSNAEVATFTFTDSPNSYAERTGRPANVGVIGVALFREYPPQTLSLPPRITRAAPAAPAEDAASAASAPAAEASAGRLSAERGPPGALAGMAEPAPKLGTGHGERELSYVQSTEFRRLQAEPNEVVRIRYDSLENLVAMGVIRRPRPQPLLPNAFPGSQERFVPDPPG